MPATIELSKEEAEKIRSWFWLLEDKVRMEGGDWELHNKIESFLTK